MLLCFKRCRILIIVTIKFNGIRKDCYLICKGLGCCRYKNCYCDCHIYRNYTIDCHMFKPYKKDK